MFWRERLARMLAPFSIRRIILAQEGVRFLEELDAIGRPAKMMIAQWLFDIAIGLSGRLQLCGQFAGLLHGDAQVQLSVTCACTGAARKSDRMIHGVTRMVPA